MGIPLWEDVDDEEDIESADESADYSNFEAEEDVPEDLTEALSDYEAMGFEPEIPPMPEEVIVPVVEEAATSSEPVEVGKPPQLWSDDSSADVETAEYTSREVQITKKTNAIEYPFLYMNLGKQCAVEVNLIKAMLRQGVQDSEDPYYHVYLNINGQVVQPEGVICCRELKTLLTTSIFKDVEKHIKLDADTTLKDEMMLALCMIDVF